MTDWITHLTQAQHNTEFAQQTLNNHPDFRDWAITAAFYAAVHYVEACFYKDKKIKHTEDAAPKAGLAQHTFRLETLKDNAKSVYVHYKILYTACMDVRYLENFGSPPKDWQSFFTEADVKNLVEKRLPAVKDTLQKRYKVKFDP